jgi:hypothetical protein
LWGAVVVVAFGDVQLSKSSKSSFLNFSLSALFFCPRSGQTKKKYKKNQKAPEGEIHHTGRAA